MNSSILLIFAGGGYTKRWNIMKHFFLPFFLLILAVFANVFAIVRSVKEAHATAGALIIDQSISGSLTSGAFTDSANSAYILDPANTGNSLLVAGNIGIGTTSPGTALSVNGIISGSTGNLRLQATGTGTGSTGTSSIYFLDSSGTTTGRFDTFLTSSNVNATGGTITTSGGYKIHTFTSSGTFTPGTAGNVEYLVVGGGGGGGSNAGAGGGAGGLSTADGFAVTAQAYTITVGAGGAADINGSNSVFSTITATGGGKGVASSGNGSSGGSGGGGAATGTGGSGTAGQGNAGGNGNGQDGASRAGAGGGGAGAVGQNTVSSSVPGAGGTGIASSISGSSVTYAGGGGGAAHTGTGASGGSGGGGRGGDGNYPSSCSGGTAGTANTGGGGGAGGGGGCSGAAGGSGIVIIRYITSSYGTLYLGTTNTSSADLAEYYVAGDKTLSAGDVVSISNTKVLDDDRQEVTNQGVMRKADKPYDSKLLGIISTNPGVVLGSIDGDTGKADKRMLSLSGRMPVKIAPDSQDIDIGDFLTSSDSHPGMAMKATRAGYTIGKALESWQSGGPAMIEVFVNLGYNMGPIEQIVKELQEENKKLQIRVSKLEETLTRLTQYGTNTPAPNR